MNRLSLAITTVTAFSLFGLAQSSPKPVSQAKSSSKVPPSLTMVDIIKIRSEPADGFSVTHPLRCDADGNIFLRVQPEVEPAIRKFDSSGVQKVLFKPSTIPDMRVEMAAYFSIDGHGAIHQLVGASFTDWYVVTYRSDGAFQSKISLHLEFQFRPFQLATFPSGELLISGLKRDNDSKNHVRLPFTGIFAGDGTLLKEVVLKDDETVNKMATAGDPAIVPEGRRSGNTAIEGGDMVAGADGNVYIMRKLSPATIYAISSGGEVVRQFRVDPNDPDFLPVSMQIASNRIAVVFLRSHAEEKTLPKDVIVKIVDLEGRDLATYGHLGEYGIALTCYSPIRELFTFVTTTDNYLGFAVAEPR